MVSRQWDEGYERPSGSKAQGYERPSGSKTQGYERPSGSKAQGYERPSGSKAQGKESALLEMDPFQMTDADLQPSGSGFQAHPTLGDSYPSSYLVLSLLPAST